MNSEIPCQSNQLVNCDVIDDTFQSASAIVYALRRGGDRQETFCLVNKLMKLCNFNNGNFKMNVLPDDDTTKQFQMNLIKQMMSAGVVQALLSTLSRANEWPEIEKNISIVLSVLVTCEDDSTLVQRSAGTILTALYTLQIKSRTTLKGNQNMQVTGGSSQESNCLCYSNSLLQDVDDDEQKNEHDALKGLLAAAVAKLSLVLASELGKLVSPLMSGSGAFGGSAAAMNENTGIININQGHNNISSSVNSNRNSRNFFKSNGAPAIVENERILQILLNLIQTLCDDFLNELTIMQQLQHLTVNNLTHSNTTFNDITITPPRIDKAVIQCSAALYRLAEVPQCRPVLVSNGALKLIKAWLEVGTHNLTMSRSVCFEENAEDKINKIEYFEQFGPVYELVSNAAAALMYISGGIDYRQIKYRVHTHSNSSHFSYGNGGRDYVVGWIDAQILSEGLPTVVVNLIHKSMESFTSLEKVETGGLTRSILPAAISMHLVQALYQLYSRPQNRQQLQSIDVSHALCILFENITSQAKLIADQASMKRNHPSNSNVQTGINSDCPSNNIYLDIFHYGIDSSQYCSNVSQKNLSKLNANTLNAINTVPALLLSYMDDTLNPTSVSCESPGKHISHKIIVDEYELHPNDVNIVYFASKQLSDDIMMVLSSVTSSCLEVLTCLFVNELNNMVPFSPNHPTSNLLMNKNSSYNFNIRTSTPSLGLNKSIYHSVSELVCHKTLVESIKVASSLLPRGKGRLSTIRIISALTDSPEVLSALFKGGIMEILISVTSEAANLQTKFQTATDLKAEKNNQINSGFAGLESSNSFFHTIFSVKPALERTCSGASSLSGLSSATSNHPRTSKYLGGSQYFNEDDEAENDDGDDDDASYFKRNIGIEETHLVCNSLANLCEAQESYAQYLFSKNMFKVMLQLVRTNHMEISRQALRCISAMCKNVTSQSSVDEDSGGDKFRGGSPPHFRETVINNKSKISSNNFAMFLEALDILCQCIRSSSSSIQRDATYTIALLALVNEKLQDRIVEGPLRTIVSLMVDPTVPRSIRSVAEDVLRNLGFLSGVKDFELCGYDFEILKDWYFMKRSLRHQDIALVILRKWVERLFEAEYPSRQQQHSSEFELHHQLHDSIIYSNELAQETANILNRARSSSVLHTVDNSTGNFIRNESESNLGLSNNAAIGSNTQTLNNKAEIRCNSDKVSSSKTMLTIPTFQRHFTETVRRFLPFLVNPGKPYEVEKADSINNTTKSNSTDAYSVPITHFIDRNGTTPNNTNNNTNIVHTGLPVSCSLGSIGSLAGLAAGLTSPSNAGVRTGRHQNGNFMNNSSIDENYDWLDRPPAGILHLLDLFYSSKLHQILLMDLTSIGVILSTPHHSSPVHESNEDCVDPSINDISTSSILGNDVSNNDNDNNFSVDVGSYYVLPHPHAVSSIILPSRSYQSFTRVGRVIEKMIEFSDQNKMWSLLFRDSEYMGDFHTSLLSTLRKCPQICSLSFAGTQRVEDDALLGHLVGQIPPSIRFLSFKSTLSRESIQALCILLRSHNAAFSVRDNDNLANNSVHSHNHNSNDIALLKLTALDNESNNMNPRRRKTIGSRGKGLLGLALTHLTFENTEINYIIELLQQHRTTKPSQRHSGTTKSVVSSSSTVRTIVPLLPLLRNRSMSDSTLQSPESISSPSSLKSSIINNSNKKETVKGGIRFLDLSYNSLSDFTCGRILSGALLGPLEGLELRGNSIGRSIKFAEVMDFFSVVKMVDSKHRLRYLGLSHNSLTSKAVAGILEPLVSNCTLTSLDLSDNEIEHSKEFNDTLRNFLRLNTGLRQLDLCNNHLNADTFKEIHLGLLENNSLLLLPLAGNYAVDKSPTISLIQIKLRENRLLYKSQAQTEFDIIQQSNLTAYQSEEELGLRISSTSNNILELGIDMNAISVLLDDDDDDMSVQDKAVLSTEVIPAIVPTALVVVSNNEQPMKNLLSQHLNNSDESHLNSQPNPTLTSFTCSTREEIKTNDSLNTTLKSEYDVGGVNQDSDGGISIAIAVPIIDRSRAFSHDYQSSPGKSIPIIRTYSSETRDNQYTTQKIPNKTKSTFDDVNISAKDNNNVSSEDNNTRSSSSSNNALVITTSDLANTTSLDLLASTPYEQFSHNTLNVFFSAPLAGFDSKKKPHPLEVLDYNAERELLMQVFKEVHRDVSVHFDFATTDALRTALSLGCKALHFSGHGFPKGLCFEDGRSGLQIIRVPQLKDLLGAGGLNLQFVFVSACYSMEIGEAFVKAGVPHVVCVKVNCKIQDVAAVSFTRAFYVAFLSGKTVKASFSIAKEALKVSPYVSDSLLEVNKFVLIPDYSSNDSTSLSENNNVQHHNKLVFINKPLKSEWPIPGKHCTIGSNRLDVKSFYQARSKLPNPPADFEGREVIVYLLIRSVLERRLVSLVGADGMGKSSVAAAACKYLSDREAFPDSIIYFKAKKGADYRAFLSGLQHSILTSGISNIMLKMQALLNSQTGYNSTLHLVYPEEENIITCLESSRMLLVLDSIDDLVADYDESHADFRLFIGRLFEQCPFVKILVAVVDTLSMHNITVGFGIVEYSVTLGPLSLPSSLRLFAKLAPSLSTSVAKKEFINALQPARHISVAVDSHDINNIALEILHLFGDGHPSKIVHMACESTSEKVEYLKQSGMNIISNNSMVMDAHSVSSYRYSIQTSVSGLL